ncbi:ankyrin repeat domain-containing protein 24 isoform X2 [Rhinichthys klamathensis goyatoka]|uniref:ankyrin repeat domain-containing protein 24 isoform X2 n=1 Tax=Rhinichthys klamathensis goyatoka TaxID=3034132 RepID=UPI0024B4C3C7|nr:ankyrin repeat domain-containing protein 24 isoform X2 [Rhinichthys klamathensis goyatoka]
MKTLKAKFKKTESQDWSKTDDRLLQAVEQNDPEKVSMLLVKKGLCPSKLDTEGKSAFHLCASRGRLDCLEVILSHGVDINVTDGTGFNALHLAAKNGQSDCLKRLLQERMPVDSTDSFGRTSLHHAAVSGCLSCTEILWDFKANLDAQDGDGSTPLILGAQMSRVELCAFLLERGANPNIQDNQGRSALMLACESDSMETVEMLLKGGAYPHLTDALGHNSAHYSITAGNQNITKLLQNEGVTAAAEGSNEEQAPPTPNPPSSGTTPRKRKAPPPPKSPAQGPPPSSDASSMPPPPDPTQSPESQSPSPPSPAPRTQRPPSENLTEDEEVFEEIRKLRLERGRLLQKIKVLEQQQSSATTALEELNSLRERLSEAEAKRDRLLAELEELRTARVSGVTCDSEDAEDSDDMLDFPGAEKLLSRQSRGLDADSPADRDEGASQGNPAMVEQLRRKVEELTSQNVDLVLKVQMLEMFEKDDTDMQSSGPDFVSTAQYESLRKEFEELQEKYSRTQASTEASSIAEDPGSEEKEEKHQNAMKEQLAQAQAELEELKEQMLLGVYSVEDAGAKPERGSEATEKGANLETQQLKARVQELEAELSRKKKDGERLREGDNDTIQQLKERVKELEADLQDRRKGKEGEEETETVVSLKKQVEELEKALEQSKTAGRKEGEGAPVNGLQTQVEELERELKDSVPRVRFEEVQVTLGLQLNQIAQERADVATRLNQALLELERLRPPSHIDENEDDEDPSESSEVSIASEHSLHLSPGGRTLEAIKEELEVARQEAAQALDSLCAEKESRAHDVLQLRDAIPLVKHQEALSAVAQQLAQTEKELQAERALREHAQTELARLQAELQALQKDSVSKEEHDKVKAELELSLEESRQSATAAQDFLSERETELKELRSQKASEQGLVSKEDHEAQRLSLQAEINTLTAQLADLARKHEKTCIEVFQVQRDALFNKSERQVAESQLETVKKQLADLQAESTHIQQLHQDIQHSQGLVKEKDRKITDLSKEVFRLKEALGALSPPLGRSQSPPSSGTPGQQLALQNRVTTLTQQVQDWERKHKAVVSIYRSHLLAAVQGRMDEEVQALLLQILRMTHKGQN